MRIPGLAVGTNRLHMCDPDDQAQRITGQGLEDEICIERGSLGRADAGWHVCVSCNEEIDSSLLDDDIACMSNQERR